MSDKFTVLFDYRKALGRTRSQKNNVDTTIELGPWLDVWENKKKMFNMRLFYILKPNAENDVIKFGIAGQNSGNYEVMSVSKWNESLSCSQSWKTRQTKDSGMLKQRDGCLKDLLSKILTRTIT